jgi:hypothetical protein
MLGGISNVGSYHRNGATGCSSQHKGLGQQLWWILSGSILAAAAEAAASERVGGLCRYSILCLGGIGNVGSYHRNAGNGLLKSTRKGLGYNFGGSFR